jgi:osmotically-inducible protein OsmY
LTGARSGLLFYAARGLKLDGSNGETMKATCRTSLAIASPILLFFSGCQTMRSEATVNVPTIEGSQDQALSRSVRERLGNVSKVNLGGVNVISSHGTVYLTGTVTSLDAREQAARIAWNAPGVETVVNTLQVQK